MTVRPARVAPVVVAIAVAVALATAGCGRSDDPSSSARDDGTTTTSSGPKLSGTLNVFAASSLTESFTELGTAFEAAHPGLQVTFNFAASSALAQQLNEGGAADVFVSADSTNMKKVTDAGNADGARIIARNRLAILVERGNPKAVKDLADLAKPDVVTVLCAPVVPCGSLAAAALQKAGVTAKPASLEENVKAVVAKVTLGEADAGIVYATDVRAAGDKAQGVDLDAAIADDPALEAVYPMATSTKATNPDAAAAWLAFLLTDESQRTLATYGFLAP